MMVPPILPWLFFSAAMVAGTKKARLSRWLHGEIGRLLTTEFINGGKILPLLPLAEVALGRSGYSVPWQSHGFFNLQAGVQIGRAHV